ncbi:uncharacterized protein EI97DRAFT_431159 [Westerdykella ornata]|uniref:C2H2-type domain-containing protein n=1 Tax=Westerdykella ornata TaxID=318751 RepID=A0A6A6JQJ9_WESOR|nr:uncharacterized protein EI97DRAFT_431159 [Westerdykella ornata]KAF2278920.1 hypothetical protein EI97DRAFT_431159 [Westerdykella ornata]
MTKKRKRYPDLNQKLERPWCYYCERDFDDLKILISHQKAKHFKCDRCGRRLNTAGGLSVHMNQVHKESLTQVENAIPGRQGLDIEIFGMEGVPQEIIDQHNHQVTLRHFEEEAERARISGNPIRGLHANGTAHPEKRPKVKESIEDIAARAAKYRQDRANGVLAAPVDMAMQASPPNVAPFGAPVSLTPPFAPGAQAYPPPGAPPGAAGFPPAQTFPPGAPGFAQPPFPVAPPFGAGIGPVNTGLPPRPGSISGPPGAFPPAQVPPGQISQPPPSALSASVDELISSAAAASAPAPDAAEKKSKKDKNIKLIYFDESVSPEEKMAKLPRYASAVRT